MHRVQHGYTHTYSQMCSQPAPHRGTAPRVHTHSCTQTHAAHGSARLHTRARSRVHGATCTAPVHAHKRTHRAQCDDAHTHPLRLSRAAPTPAALTRTPRSPPRTHTTPPCTHAHIPPAHAGLTPPYVGRHSVDPPTPPQELPPPPGAPRCQWCPWCGSRACSGGGDSAPRPAALQPAGAGRKRLVPGKGAGGSGLIKPRAGGSCVEAPRGWNAARSGRWIGGQGMGPAAPARVTATSAPRPRELQSASRPRCGAHRPRPPQGGRQSWGRCGVWRRRGGRGGTRSGELSPGRGTGRSPSPRAVPEQGALSETGATAARGSLSRNPHGPQGRPSGISLFAP